MSTVQLYCAVLYCSYLLVYPVLVNGPDGRHMGGQQLGQGHLQWEHGVSATRTGAPASGMGVSKWDRDARNRDIEGSATETGTSVTETSEVINWNRDICNRDMGGQQLRWGHLQQGHGWSATRTGTQPQQGHRGFSNWDRDICNRDIGDYQLRQGHRRLSFETGTSEVINWNRDMSNRDRDICNRDRDMCNSDMGGHQLGQEHPQQGDRGSSTGIGTATTRL